MTSIKLILTGAHAWASVEGPLTSGMVGIPVTIEYDDAWDGLTKNLMCRCSPWNSNDGEIRTILNVGETSTVAHEVMQTGMYLHLGIEGFSSDGTLVIPTTWARCGKIEYGANTCDDLSTEPELPIWNQLRTEVEEIKRDGYTQEQLAEIQAYVQSAVQAASNAERSKDNAVAASNVALSNATAARNAADTAQASAENASTSAGSAANLANGALQAQRAAEAAAERAEAAADSGGNTSLAAEQADALDGMFQAAAYDASSNYTAAYAAFRAAFGLTCSGDSDGDIADKTLVSISASYSGGEVPVGTAATTLSGVVVTATYDDGSTAAVTGYTLSGSIAEGSNTITVTYQGKTATFTVTGVAESGEVLDTSPVIEYEGHNLSQDDGSLVESANFCVTKFYEFDELTAQRDFSYLTGSSAVAACHNADGTWLEWFSGRTTEKTSHMPVGAAKIRFAIQGGYLNKSYAYWSDTGEVIFAAPGAEHYGKTHVTLAESEATA